MSMTQEELATLYRKQNGQEITPENPKPRPVRGPIWNTAWGVFWGMWMFAITGGILYAIVHAA